MLVGAFALFLASGAFSQSGTSSQMNNVSEEDLPASAREELERRGMTIEEARRRAELMGIDLSNPQQAIWRARELGIPESQIREMINVVQGTQATAPSAGIRRIGFEDTTSLFTRMDTMRAERDTFIVGQDTLIMSRDSLRIGERVFLRADTARVDTTDSLRVKQPLRHFGYDFFEDIPEAFQPSNIGPVDDGYIVGPLDELRLIVWGSTEFQYELQVDREGRIFVPDVGQLTVSGKTLEELRSEVKTWLSRKNAGLTTSPPTAFMDLTVTRLKPIYVYVLGEVKKPGGYTVSSYSSVFNVMYAVGGPKRSGSLREIRVIRNGEVIGSVDLYELLLKGYESDPIRLRNNDRIFIPPRGKTVAIDGMIKRRAIYEMKDEETFTDLLEFAGGLKPDAYVKRFQITRIIPFAERSNPSVAREVLDLSLTDALTGAEEYRMEDGDRVQVSSILAQLRNSAFIDGAVRQPGQYELGRNLRTVKDLVLEADSLTGDAYMFKADLVRVQPDSSNRMISLNLMQAMDDDPYWNLPLKPLDSLYVYSTINLNKIDSVQVSGQVRTPGTYAYMDSMTVSDLLFKAGGLQDPEYLRGVYLERADIYRDSDTDLGTEIMPFHLGDALNGEGYADTLLRPNDEIEVYPRGVEEFVLEKIVNIAGAVKFPGEYVYSNNMTLEDLIIQSGGFGEGAYLESAEVSRILDNSSSENDRATSIKVPLVPRELLVSKVSFGISDTMVAMQNARQFTLRHRDRVYIRTDPAFQEQDTVVVTGEVRYPGQYTLLQENETLFNLLNRVGGVLPTAYPKGGRLIRAGEQVIVEIEELMEGQARADVILKPGDEIIIPPTPNTVTVRGNVANEGLIKFNPGRRVNYYLDRAGGVGEMTQSVFLTQASGATYKISRHWYWFNENPVVDDGAIIRVTREPERDPEERVNIAETMRDVTTILTTTLTLLVLADRAGI